MRRREEEDGRRAQDNQEGGHGARGVLDLLVSMGSSPLNGPAEHYCSSKTVSNFIGSGEGVARYAWLCEGQAPGS